MLYIGNFSYNDQTNEADNYVIMPCVVEAANAEEALEKFRAHLTQAHEQVELMAGAEEIYLDSLVELAAAPSEPVVCQWQKIMPDGEGLVSIAGALPFVGEGAEGAEAYTWAAEGAQHDCCCGGHHEDGEEHECCCGHDHDEEHECGCEDGACDCEADDDSVMEEPFLRF